MSVEGLDLAESFGAGRGESGPVYDGSHTSLGKDGVIFYEGAEIMHDGKAIAVRKYADVVDGAGYWVVGTYAFDRGPDEAGVLIFPTSDRNKPIKLADPKTEAVDLKFSDPRSLGTGEREVVENLREAVDRVTALLVDRRNPGDLAGAI